MPANIAKPLCLIPLKFHQKSNNVYSLELLEQPKSPAEARLFIEVRCRSEVLAELTSSRSNQEGRVSQDIANRKVS